MATAVVLLCDSNFLVPTVGTALAARSHTSDPAVGIFVYVVDRENHQLEALRHVLAPRGVELAGVKIAQLDQVKSSDFNRTHVPVSAMSRLWIDAYLPPQFAKFLYIDGDVDITGSLDPLLALDVPAGGFLAAPDLPFLAGSDYGKFARSSQSYIEGLGVVEPDAYFNDGVLLAGRRGWAEIGAQAWAYFKRNPHRCRYHEQSALNAVAGARRGWLPLVWNYQSDFMAVADPRQWGIEPTIWHFTGYPKPWHAAVYPWSNGFGRSYRLGAAAFRAAGVDTPAPPAAHSVAAAVDTREKLQFRLRWVYPWRRIRRAQKIRAALALAPQSSRGVRPSTLAHVRRHNKPSVMTT
jgi:lipopolysaccharide biosynthesis glycosyltransferase